MERNRTFKFRISQSNYEELDRRAKAAGVSKGELIHMMLGFTAGAHEAEIDPTANPGAAGLLEVASKIGKKAKG